MADRVIEIAGVLVLECAADGETIGTERDALQLIQRTFESGAQVVAIPVERLAADFFRLRTTIAGAMVQKFVQYRRRMVIVGDVSQFASESSAFAAFVEEANRGRDLWFVRDWSELQTRMES